MDSPITLSPVRDLLAELELSDLALDALPVGICVCDHDGLIVRFNRAAAALWGREPGLNDPADRFCGSLRLRRPGGGAIAHADGPMAEVLAGASAVRDRELVIERPDGSAVHVVMDVSPLSDADRRRIGAVACFRPAATVLQRKANEQAALYRFTDRLYRSHALPEVYEAALDAIIEGLGCSRASILRFDDSGVMRFVAAHGLSETYCKAVEGHSPWRRGDRDAEPVYISDIETSDQPESLKATVRAEGIRALAFFPLALDGEVIGKFMAYYDEPHEFTKPDIDAALTIARQLGFAIDRDRADVAARRLIAIVESSEDAIIAKDLNGIITDWNTGAERLFGYTADEMVGKPVTTLMPPDRVHEEVTILSRIRSGEPIGHYETVRQRKNGSLVDVSLSISPIKDASGRIIGASKIARDISERRRAQEQQQLLLHEMNHRIKNLFALTISIVNLSARSAATPQALAATATDRLHALARAHSLTLSRGLSPSARGGGATTLHALIEAVLSPYDRRAENGKPHLSINGDDLPVASSAVTPVALLLHEFATNAAKYGCLSSPDGRVEIVCASRGPEVVLTWREIGGPAPRDQDDEGFGSRLVNATAGQLGGKLTRQWNPDGLRIELALPRDSLCG